MRILGLALSVYLFFWTEASAQQPKKKPPVAKPDTVRVCAEYFGSDGSSAKGDSTFYIAFVDEKPIRVRIPRSFYFAPFKDAGYRLTWVNGKLTRPQYVGKTCPQDSLDKRPGYAILYPDPVPF